MTRINVIAPAELHSKHLLAEYRELPRVFSLVERYQAQGGTPASLTDQPSEYVLGKGHVKFFYTRLLWLHFRHQALVMEMDRRGFKPNFRKPLLLAHHSLDVHWHGDWEPTAEAMTLNRARIAERLEGMKQ